MKPELQKKLYDKHPLIFADKDLPMDRTCMCWGIECGDGWYDILDALCDELENIHQNYGLITKATQVKEKFGTLRFYTRCHYDDEMVEEREDGQFYQVAYRNEGKCVPYEQSRKMEEGPDCIARGAINMAERMSAITCEICGSSHAKLRGGGWLVTWCDKCYDADRADQAEKVKKAKVKKAKVKGKVGE
jgi:hypothetical protein